MKRSAGLIFCLLLFGALQAQRKPSRFFTEVSIGVSIPVGQFAEMSYNGPNEFGQSGMAAAGFNGNVLIGYFLKKSYGVLLQVGYSLNKQRSEGYANYVKSNLYPGATEVNINTGSWEVLRLMAGFFRVTTVVKNKLHLITKLSGGICKTTAPGYSYIAWGNTGPGFAGGEEAELELPTAFCYQAGAGFKYNLNDKIHLFIDVNYFHAKSEKEIKPNPWEPAPGEPYMPYIAVPLIRTYKLGSVNTLAGVGFSF